jgi:hypothetical protein
MEIAIIPQFFIRKLTSNFYRQNDYNIILSNLFIIIFFALFSNSLMSILSYIPHFCLIDKLIGFECPVCGTTRAFCEISNGNITSAYQLNATSILVAAFFIIQIPLRLVSIFKEQHTKIINKISKYFSQTILAIILLNWIINLFINN